MSRHTSRRRSTSRRRRWLKLSVLLPKKRTRRGWWRALRRAPAFLQVALVLAVATTVFLTVNWTYQVVRKPSELWFPVAEQLYKTPEQTWWQYGALFRKHATETIPPELLAALAQIEGSGNPIVRTYWRWALTHEPFEIYRPASSAVGMYQITDGTFAQARRYCVHNHVVVEDGPWHDVRSCWFNALYTRTVPSHAVELTAAFLDRAVARALGSHSVISATSRQKQDLAAVAHLCGAGAAAVYVRHGLKAPASQRCGDHAVRGYVDRVNQFVGEFARLHAADR
jgi:hypothetical protein